jgi:peptidoglycan/LPS O-acetylase OafA/YrhL
MSEPVTIPEASATKASAASEGAAPGRPRVPFFGLDLLDNRYPALHGIRVLAILSVIQYHVTWIFTGEQNIALDQDFTEHSLSIFFGMDLFFVLSGFLIGSILHRSLEVSGTQNIRRFYIRRVFRTFPSYYLVLTFLALAFPLTDAQQAHLPYEYVYLTNFEPLQRDQIVMFWGWSLALEEQFYLTVPLLFVVLHRLRSDRDRLVLLALIVAAGLLARLWVYETRGPWTNFTLYDTLYFRTQTRFDPIVAGILLAVIEQRYGERVHAWLQHPLHRAMLALPSLLCMWIASRPDILGTEHEHIVHVFAWGTLTSLMYLGFVPLLLHGDGPIQRFCAAPIFRRLATLGYGVYLVHIPLIDHLAVPWALDMQEQQVSMLYVWPAAFAGVTVVSFAIGYVLHVLVEKPSLRIREWLAA